MNYEEYDAGMHRLFLQAFDLRCDKNSLVNELFFADKCIADALALCDEFGQGLNNVDIQCEVENNRLRCFIERLAIHSRLLKIFFATPKFLDFAKTHEQLCLHYINYNPTTTNAEIEQSMYQLHIMSYQSLSGNYYRQSKTNNDELSRQQAIVYIDKAIELSNGDENHTILLQNKEQILRF